MQLTFVECEYNNEDNSWSTYLWSLLPSFLTHKNGKDNIEAQMDDDNKERGIALMLF